MCLDVDSNDLSIVCIPGMFSFFVFLSLVRAATAQSSEMGRCGRSGPSGGEFVINIEIQNEMMQKNDHTGFDFDSSKYNEC